MKGAKSLDVYTYFEFPATSCRINRTTGRRFKVDAHETRTQRVARTGDAVALSTLLKTSSIQLLLSLAL